MPVEDYRLTKLEDRINNLKEDHSELSGQVKMLSLMTERLIRLEEREETRHDGIKRAHGRIDFLVKMFWSMAGSIALAIFTVWLSTQKPGDTNGSGHNSSSSSFSRGGGSGMLLRIPILEKTPIKKS